MPLKTTTKKRSKRSKRSAAAARELQITSPGTPPLTTLKESSPIMEVLFKNVFLKGAINFIKEKREGRTVPVDLGAGAPNRLWEVIIDGAEREVNVGICSLSRIK